MKLHGVTITGADDHSRIEELAAISAKYPFVEWGLLVGRSQGRRGYPKLDTIRDLIAADLRVALHLCGGVATETVKHARCEWLKNVPANRLCRVQVNLFSRYLRRALNDVGWRHTVLSGIDCVLAGRLAIDRQIAETLRANDIGVLFDWSAGTGRRSDSWPPALTGLQCGYAGGLRPETLHESLMEIEEVVGDASVWIDVQSGVMSHGSLDLYRVRRFLKVAEPWLDHTT